MTDPRSSVFWQSAVSIGLVAEDALQACWEAIPADRRTPDAIDRRLARQAVNCGLVTVWQAQQILNGRQLGLKIDRYILQDLLGQGGMGRVYLARDTRLRRPVALKILSRERMNNPRARVRFGREAFVGAQLQHENLIRVYDEGDYQGVRYLVMEFIEGQTVGQMIAEQKRLPWAVAADLTRQVALGLDHLYQKNLLHRDVNPQNILVDRDGTAKLTDLGLAIAPDEDEEIVTRDGATVGTFDYISPEQARHSRAIDTRSDIYSLGCTLYHMLAGQVPFPAPSLPEKLFAHQSSEPKSLSELVSGLPAGLEDVVRRMMAKRPEDRYARPRDVARALERFALPAGVGGAGGPPTPWMAMERRGGSQTVSDGIVAVGSDPDLTARPTAPLPDGGPSARPAGAHSAVEAPSSDGAPPVLPSSSGSNSASEDPFKLNLGPPLPLSDSLSESRSRDGDEVTVSPLWLGVVLAAVLGGISLLAIYLAWSWGGSEAAGVATGPGAGGRPAGAAAVAAEPRPPITVEYDNGDFEPADTLADAVRSAVSKPARVVLRNTVPIVLGPEKPFPVLQGPVEICAAEGFSPMLDVTLTPGSSLPAILGASPNAALTLRHLTVLVRGGGPATLIEAHGPLTLDHVMFKASGAGAEAISPVRAEGAGVEAVGCGFSGFLRPLQAKLLPGQEVSLRNCMLARPGSDDPNAWAVTVEPLATDQEGPRRVSFDRCTAFGLGLASARRFDTKAPLTLEVHSSVAVDPALLEWEGDFPAGLNVMGRENLYEIRGPAWVVSPGGAFAPAPGGPDGWDAWKALAGGETGSEVRDIRFLHEPADPGQFTPADLIIEGLDGLAPGADPTDVGPR